MKLYKVAFLLSIPLVLMLSEVKSEAIQAKNNNTTKIKPIQEFKTVREYNQQFTHPEIKRLQKIANKKCIYFIETLSNDGIPSSEDKIVSVCSKELKENLVVYKTDTKKMNRKTSNSWPTSDK